MTFREFSGLLEEMGTILKMEMGEEVEEPTSLTGEPGFALARRIFPKGKRKCRS